MKQQEVIMEMLTKAGAYGVSTSEMTVELDTTGSSVRRRLTDLKRAGLVAIHTNPEDKPENGERVWVLSQYAQVA